MPVIRISDATYARLQTYAKPFEDSPDSVISKALTALDMMSGDTETVGTSAPSKRIEGPKLPQKEFRIPLLVTLLDLGGTAPAKAVRERMEPLMAPRLGAETTKVSQRAIRVGGTRSVGSGVTSSKRA